MKKLDFRDMLLLAGGGLISYGLYLIYAPLMFITLGAFLVLVGWPKRR